MKVREMMTRKFASVGPDSTLTDAARLMWECDCGFVPVVDLQSGNLVGVVTDRDACMAAYTQGTPFGTIRVATAMAKKVHTCRAEDDVSKAQELMRRNQLRRLPVLDKAGKLVGVLSLSDLVRVTEKSRSAALRKELCSTLAAVTRPRASAATA